MENQKIITNEKFNDDKIKSFTTYKKTRKQDSISWIIIGLFLFFFTAISMGRITIVGQFFDDVIFNLIFGWFKYPMYIILLFVDIVIYAGVKFKLKKRLIAMIISTFVLLCWLISISLMIDIYHNQRTFNEYSIKELWQKDIFTNSFGIYFEEWKNNAIFTTAKNFKVIDYFITSGGYFNTYSGGGLIGTLTAGLTAYLSIPGSFILMVILMGINTMWILTGDALYFFKPKSKRHGKKIRILKLKSKENPNKNINNVDQLNKEEVIQIKKDNSLWTDLKVFDNMQALDEAIEESDITIELPFYGKKTEIEVANVETPVIAFEKDETVNQLEKFNLNELEEEATFFVDKELKKVTPSNETLFEKNSSQQVKFTQEISDDDFFDELYEGKDATVYVEPPKPIVKINKNYKNPSIDLLQKFDKDPNKELANKKIAQEKADAINEVFNHFNVKANVINTIIGPSVTKFEIQPDIGTRVNSITKLEEDLKLALASKTIRIESPIQGKNLVGIEIANPSAEIVSLREMMESIPSSKKDEKLLFVLGKNVLGEPLTAELNKMPHLLVAGSTGSGKSVMINTLICSILLRAKPIEVRFLMIDPKKVELSGYSGIPHMLTPVISDMKQASNSLKMIVSEMERRYVLFTENGVKNMASFNEKNPNNKLPFIVVIIDELADLMMTGDRKGVEESIMRITQMARAAGIHLIVATQRPSVDVLTGTIKSNIPTRIAFMVTTGTDSRTILDSSGAETLLGRGDMLFSPPGGSDLIRAQGAYMSDKEIEDIVSWTIQQQEPFYSEEFSENNLSGVGPGAPTEKDPMYDIVKTHVLEIGVVSASQIKGLFKLGDARAAGIIFELEREGIIGPRQGNKPREVIIKK
ncbi:DNA translocase FtsK [Mesoplasma photuris]|uniref:DNA translocase FtsK n=1 Tax=Mesoplasma photuris TaxID=217731 RepID=UPI0006920312|nr:DNA translocase FtsK [Mesoplasma photuris]